MTAAVGEASPYIRAQANLCTLGLHEMALDFYGALAANLQDSLDEGMGGGVGLLAGRARVLDRDGGTSL